MEASFSSVYGTNEIVSMRPEIVSIVEIVSFSEISHRISFPISNIHIALG